MTGPERVRVLRIIARMNVGGPSRQVTALSRHLDPERFEHRLLVGDVGADEVDDLALRGADVPHVRIRGLGRAPGVGDDLRAFAALVGEVRRFRPHVVHTHTAKAGALGRVAALVASLPTGRGDRPRLVHTFHGHLLHGYFSAPVTAAVVTAERMLAARTDRLVAVGDRVRRELVAAGVGAGRPWEVVPPGIDLGVLPTQGSARAALGLEATAPVVAFVARLIPVKRPDRFVEVAQRVAAAVPEATFVVAGEGPLGDDARARVADAGLGARFRWLGWTGDVETVYSASDVVLLTSDNEGMPVSLVEAALAGTPAVTTDVGSAAEVVRDGETGAVHPADDVDGLAASVVSLLQDEARRTTWGAAAQRWADERFSGRRLAADLARVYEELVASSGR